MFKRVINSFQARYPKIAAIVFDEVPMEEVPELNSSASQAWSKTIPNHIYMTWEENKFGKTHSAGLRQFRSRNMDCHFHLFNSKDCDEYMHTYYKNHRIYDVYMSAKPGAMKADIWRYCILYERGGFYFDINKCIEVPLSEYVLKDDLALVSYENNFFTDVLSSNTIFAMPTILRSDVKQHLQFINRPLLNWGLACVSAHPIFKKTIDNIVDYANYFRDKVFTNIREPIITLTGPIMFTRSYYDCLSENVYFSARQCGIDFDGMGNPNMNGGWVRYIRSKSYVRVKNNKIFD